MQRGAFLGVFSLLPGKDEQVIRRRLFFVWCSEQADVYIAQRLDGGFRPAGKFFTLTIDELRSQYKHEPKVMVVPEGYALAGQRKKVAAVPVKSDPKEVEATLREHFRKAMLRIKRKEVRTAAREALMTLVEVEEGIVPQHKHMFTEFGINLRKQRELDLALAFYQRVLTLAPNDDHAHFNMARVLLEMGEYESAAEYAQRACTLCPETKVHHKILRHINLMQKKHQRPRKRA